MSTSTINTATPSVTPLYKPDLPNSQESLASVASSAFAAPTLLSLSSNISTSTTVTELTPPSSNAPSSQKLERALPASPTQPRRQNARTTAPRIDTSNASRTGDTAASPMSLASPMLAHGPKRTADGELKGETTVVDSPVPAGRGHKRTKSESGSKIGELSAQLKTRLSYAMMKVQNGWEKQSLEELEERTSQHGSPISVPGRTEGYRPSLESPRYLGRRRSPSGFSENSDQMMMSPGQPSPPKVSGSDASFWRATNSAQTSGHVNSIAISGSENGPMLAPAAEIGHRRKRRSSTTFAPPPLLGSYQRKHYSDLGGAVPRTPTAVPRAGILRMPSQQAEKDAVDTLLFMSSPNNSGRFPHTVTEGHAAPSPLRSEFSRRVVFESSVLNDKLSTQPQQQGKGAPYAAYYPANAAR